MKKVTQTVTELHQMLDKVMGSEDEEAKRAVAFVLELANKPDKPHGGGN